MILLLAYRKQKSGAGSLSARGQAKKKNNAKGNNE